MGIVGFGWVARDYMWPSIDAHGDAVLSAVVSVREEDFRGLPESVSRYRSVDDILATENLDAVYVASPNHLHAEHTIACLRAGLYVLCEKPLARSLAEAQTMVEAARSYDRLLITAYDQRYHPAHIVMREWVSAGKLGTVTQSRIDYACWVPSGWSVDNWRVDAERAGGGAIIDLAPHGLDLLETIIGQRIVDLHCFEQTAAHDYSVDDGGVLSARFDEDALAAITVGYNRPESLPRRRLEITGTKGMLRAVNTMGQVAGGTLSFVDADTGSMEEIPFDAATGPFHGLLDNFLAAVRGSRTEARDATNDLRLIELLGNALPKKTTIWP